MSLPTRAVIFDLGNVLVGVDAARLWERLSGVRDPGAGVEGLVRDDLMVRWCTGRLSPAEFHRAVMRRTGLDLGFSEFVRWWCDVFVPMPGMDALVREVASVVPVGLLSDTDPLHFAFVLRENPFLSLFPAPTLSYLTGRMKPDPECYRAAAAAVHARPSECLFVDDLERNVAGAVAAGMPAVRFTGEAALRGELRARGVLGK